MAELNETLKIFDATEANLGKLVRLWEEMEKLIPEGICFGDDENYEEKCRLFKEILKEMPSIGGYTIPDRTAELNEIAQARMDAKESGDFEMSVGTEEWIFAQGKELREYRFRFDRARKTLVRDIILDKVKEIDGLVATLTPLISGKKNILWSKKVEKHEWDELEKRFAEFEVLFGSSLKRPDRWSDMSRHIGFGEMHDLKDIVEIDWPQIKSSLARVIYAENEPLPVAVSDLTELTKVKPVGPVITELQWSILSPEDFERLMFNIVSDERGYRNPEWLMNTNAPDRGRDISVTRVIDDSLAGIENQRVIIQCKHWMSKSVGLPDFVNAKEQMHLWEPPRVDILIIATSGKFTLDAVSRIESHNQSPEALRVWMWPNSHLESILARRPGLIAEFGLRK